MESQVSPARPKRVLSALRAMGARLFSGADGHRLSEASDSVASTPPMSDFGPAPSELDASEWPRNEPGLTQRVPPPMATQWSSQVFLDIEWFRFETVCARLFEQAGFEVRLQPRDEDGGSAVWLHSKNAQGPVAIVLCRHWPGKNVGVTELRELATLLKKHKLARGTFTTAGMYTPGALRFAKENAINALDSAGLVTLIARRTPQQQRALLDVAYEGEYWRPTCGKCGIKMDERTPSRGGQQYWACANYRQCKTWQPFSRFETRSQT